MGVNVDNMLCRLMMAQGEQYDEAYVTFGELRAVLEAGIEESVYSKKFSIPTIEEVSEYCKERGNVVNPEKWWNFYSAKGWMVGKNKMKDWRAAVRTWEIGHTSGPAHSNQEGRL